MICHSCFCCIYSDELNSVVATSPSVSNSLLQKPLAISLVLNDGSRIATTHKFLYRLDPRVTNIEPRNHLLVYV